MANKEILVLRLEGVLQSWGELSKWDFRDSSNFPTKSGIVGLLGCALGEERGSKVLADLSQAITIAVRADRPGSRCIDYHTVRGNPLITAEGKSRAGGDTFVSHRAYLQDACFTVFVETSSSWMEEIVGALNTPKWSMSLGRKSCVPSRPVFQEVTTKFDSLMDAVMGYPVAFRGEYPMNYEVEIPQANTLAITRSDNLIGENRQFGTRRVWRGTIKEDSSHVFE